MVFLAVILQHHRMVRKGADIRRVINDHLSKWSNNEFDMLVEEAVWCDSTLKTHFSRADDVSVFTRLMLFGKIKAVIRWLSEQSKG